MTAEGILFKDSVSRTTELLSTRLGEWRSEAVRNVGTAGLTNKGIVIGLVLDVVIPYTTGRFIAGGTDGDTIAGGAPVFEVLILDGRSLKGLITKAPIPEFDDFGNVCGIVSKVGPGIDAVIAVFASFSGIWVVAIGGLIIEAGCSPPAICIGVAEMDGRGPADA